MSSFNTPYQYQFFDRKTALDDVVFGMSHAVRVKQTHSAACVVIDRPFADGQWVEADALVTRTPNIPIGVITADCAPIILIGDGVVAIIHAGWQGAVNGIVENTVSAMDCDPSTIQAFIGPCIAQGSYEVSKGFEKPFVEAHPEAIEFFSKKNDEKLLFDLKSYCVFRLSLASVRDVEVSNIDTLTDENYHSHRGGATSKDRNLSATMING
ncbi:MAG: polyphenol oxidase [Alphaproteobacteria bacterium]|nr:MAG: polyphenol oxidase [Alphaproteobacteria bacterium]